MIKVESRVEICEVNGSQVSIEKSEHLKVGSHWYRNELVIIVIGDQERYTVKGSDLVAAIENAQHTNRR